MLSNGFWKRKFGGNPQIVGTAISLSGDPYTIVGVLGSDFQTDPVSDMWLPFQFDPNSQNQGHFFLAAGRLICPIAKPQWHSGEYLLVSEDREETSATRAFRSWITAVARERAAPKLRLDA